MNASWIMAVLNIDKETQVGALRFVELVDQAINNCDLETARVLMRTFTTDDDNGVQESAMSALATASIEDYQRALLEEMPRLLQDAPEWANVFISRELKNNREKFLDLLQQIPNELSEVIDVTLTETNLARRFPSLVEFEKKLSVRMR